MKTRAIEQVVMRSYPLISCRTYSRYVDKADPSGPRGGDRARLPSAIDPLRREVPG